MEKNSIMPLLAMLIPLISVPVFLMRGKTKTKRIIHVVASITTFAVVLSMLWEILDGNVLNCHLYAVSDTISVNLRVDSIGYFYGLVVAFLWALATIFSTGYIDHAEDRYYAFMGMCSSFILGVAFSENMFNLFIFYELMTFASYPLIIHEGTDEAREAGLKYLVYAIFAGALILFAIVADYYWTGGNLEFREFGVLSLDEVSRGALWTIFVCYMFGFGVKAAIMPLHGWVPDAHPAAPAPASALLSGVILKAGAFGIIRVVFNVFGIDLMRELGVNILLAVFACITIIAASIFAITQDNLKRRLAYSSIGQVSYILLGVAMLAPDGALGGMMHIAHHALMKGTLFLCAGIIIARLGIKKVSEMEGLARKLPITMFCFATASLAMMGTPPSVGFISKWLLGSGSMQASHPEYLVILLVSALLNAVYFLPIIYTVFFKGDESEYDFGVEKKSKSMVAPVAVLAFLVIFAAIYVTMPGFPFSIVDIFVNLLFA